MLVYQRVFPIYSSYHIVSIIHRFPFDNPQPLFGTPGQLQGRRSQALLRHQRSGPRSCFGNGGIPGGTAFNHVSPMARMRASGLFSSYFPSCSIANIPRNNINISMRFFLKDGPGWVVSVCFIRHPMTKPPRSSTHGDGIT